MQESVTQNKWREAIVDFEACDGQLLIKRGMTGELLRDPSADSLGVKFYAVT
jgi:hypothetical protein